MSTTTETCNHEESNIPLGLEMQNPASVYGEISLRSEPPWNSQIEKKSKNLPATSHTTKMASSEFDTVLPSEESVKRTSARAIGKYGILLTALGSVVIAIAFCFLVTLWKHSIRLYKGYQIPKFWHSILYQQWSIRTVTICAVCVRIIVSAQAGLAMSMIASIVCERLGCRPAQLAEFSIIRSLSTGPHSLLLPLLQNLKKPTQMICMLIVLAYLITNLISQFTSTILLSDFENISIPLLANTSARKYGIRYDYSDMTHTSLSNETEIVDSSVWHGADPWATGLQSYPRFAEFRELPNSGEQFYDTGRIVRAFLPFRTSRERSKIRYYAGPATLISARVVCIRPKIYNIQIDHVSPNENDFLAKETYLVFNIDFSETPNNSSLNTNDYFVNGSQFNCSMSRLSQKSGFEPNSAQDELNICYLQEIGILEDNLITNPETMTDSYIIIKSKGSRENVRRLNGTKSITATGLWTAIRRDGVPASIEISLCMANPSIGDHEIHASAAQDHEEPELIWNAEERSYDLTNIRNMLGVTEETEHVLPAERGLLKLEEPASWKSYYTPTTLYLNDGIKNRLQWSYIYEYGALKIGGDKNYLNSDVHRAHVALFQDIIKTTNNPALAVQAILTILSGIVYYDNLPEFDAEANSTVTFSQQTNAPAGWRGIIIVGCALAVHFILLSIILAIFLSQTKFTLLGNSWMAVSQCVSTDVIGVVQIATEKTDAEVEQWCRKHDLGDTITISPH